MAFLKAQIYFLNLFLVVFLWSSGSQASHEAEIYETEKTTEFHTLPLHRHLKMNENTLLNERVGKHRRLSPTRGYISYKYLNLKLTSIQSSDGSVEADSESLVYKSIMKVKNKDLSTSIEITNDFSKAEEIKITPALQEHITLSLLLQTAHSMPLVMSDYNILDVFSPYSEILAPHFFPFAPSLKEIHKDLIQIEQGLMGRNLNQPLPVVVAKQLHRIPALVLQIKFLVKGGNTLLKGSREESLKKNKLQLDQAITAYLKQLSYSVKTLATAMGHSEELTQDKAKEHLKELSESLYWVLTQNLSLEELAYFDSVLSDRYKELANPSTSEFLPTYRRILNRFSLKNSLVPISFFYFTGYLLTDPSSIGSIDFFLDWPVFLLAGETTISTLDVITQRSIQNIEKGLLEGVHNKVATCQMLLAPK